MAKLSAQMILEKFWKEWKGSESALVNISFQNATQVLPSVYDVTAFASASIGLANLAATELKNGRSQKSAVKSLVEIDSLGSCAAFMSESLLKPIGWELPGLWDPIAGNYQSKDSKWIRLHTNYTYHRDAVLRVLGVSADRDSVKRAVLSFDSEALESAVVREGGCAAVMRTREEWNLHPQGKASADLPAIEFLKKGKNTAKFRSISDSELPLSQIRVIDITRVIAGPECTKFLSAQGAEVIRIDPPGFQEVPALIPETMAQKKCIALNLKTSDGKLQFEKLLSTAHVFVHGLRPGALDALGFTREKLEADYPGLIIASLSAYGTVGPWQGRRGFDSLVQMSSGIAAAGAMAKKSAEPFPLPVQALDHGLGFLLAASVCRALTELYQSNDVHEITGSLIGAANTLMQLPRDIHLPMPKKEDFDAYLREEDSQWGKLKRVVYPGKI